MNCILTQITICFIICLFFFQNIFFFYLFKIQSIDDIKWFLFLIFYAFLPSEVIFLSFSSKTTISPAKTWTPSSPTNILKFCLALDILKTKLCISKLSEPIIHFQSSPNCKGISNRNVSVGSCTLNSVVSCRIGFVCRTRVLVMFFLESIFCLLLLPETLAFNVKF